MSKVALEIGATYKVRFRDSTTRLEYTMKATLESSDRIGLVFRGQNILGMRDRGTTTLWADDIIAIKRV